MLLTNIPMDLFNFIIYVMPKVSLYGLYMLNSVLFANLYSSQGKLQENALNEEQALYF